MSTSGVVVEISSLRFQYPQDQMASLRIESLIIGEGVTAIVGSNGSGKSTLLNIIAGRLWPYMGSVTVLGIEWRSIRSDSDRQRQVRRIAYVPQEFRESEYNAKSTISDVLIQALVDGGIPSGEHVHRVRQALTAVGLAAAESRLINTLSGGQRRRVLVARALAKEAALLLVDEPTNHIDPDSSQSIIAALVAASVHTPVIVVTHDSALMQAATSHIHIDAGQLSTEWATTRVYPDGPARTPKTAYEWTSGTYPGSGTAGTRASRGLLRGAKARSAPRHVTHSASRGPQVVGGCLPQVAVVTVVLLAVTWIVTNGGSIQTRLPHSGDSGTPHNNGQSPTNVVAHSPRRSVEPTPTPIVDLPVKVLEAETDSQVQFVSYDRPFVTACPPCSGGKAMALTPDAWIVFPISLGTGIGENRYEIDVWCVSNDVPRRPHLMLGWWQGGGKLGWRFPSTPVDCPASRTPTVDKVYPVLGGGHFDVVSIDASYDGTDARHDNGLLIDRITVRGPGVPSQH